MHDLPVPSPPGPPPLFPVLHGITLVTHTPCVNSPFPRQFQFNSAGRNISLSVCPLWNCYKKQKLKKHRWQKLKLKRRLLYPWTGKNNFCFELKKQKLEKCKVSVFRCVPDKACQLLPKIWPDFDIVVKVKSVSVCSTSPGIGFLLR